MWQESDQKLQASFLFKNFAEAFAFMTEVAMIAEKMDHHPEWQNIWNRVDIQLRTHSAGNIVTEKDRKLASAIDQVFTKYRQ
jgi:4a-hydroxytetrahydrobiopterin dehydratase